MRNQPYLPSKKSNYFCIEVSLFLNQSLHSLYLALHNASCSDIDIAPHWVHNRHYPFLSYREIGCYRQLHQPQTSRTVDSVERRQEHGVH